MVRTFRLPPRLISRLLTVLLVLVSLVGSGVCWAREHDSSFYQSQGSKKLKEGRYQEAAEAFQQAVVLARQAPETAISQASVEGRQRLSRWHMDQARAALLSTEPLIALMHLERALELQPDNVDAQQLIAQTRQSANEERARLQQKVKVLALAMEMEASGDVDRARAAWQKVNALDPKDVQAQEALARLPVIVQPGTASTPPVTTPPPSMAKDADAKKPVSLVSAAEVAGTPIAGEYRISAGDVLEVFVWQQPDLSRNVIVRPDGRMSFPLVGDVPAAGLTLTQVDDTLTERLRTYLKFPDVSLAIQRFGGTKTIVLGNVSSPGVYIPTGEGRVLEVIAMAGGFKDHSGQNSVMLIRGGLNAPKVERLNLERTLRNGAVNQNVVLEPNDIVYVPKDKITDTLSFMEQFYPTISEVLVGQALANNFGIQETSGAGVTRGKGH